jgi:hypothetical protein
MSIADEGYSIRGGVLDTTWCGQVCQWLVTDQWFSLCTMDKTERHDITEILLKVALNTLTITPKSVIMLI